VEARESVETYPTVPNPETVDIKRLSIPIPITVEVTVEANSVGSMKLLTYAWSPWVVETKERVETYPVAPRPSTVDTRFPVVTSPLPPPPTEPSAVEKLEIEIPMVDWRPAVVETNERLETYDGNAIPKTDVAK
jgi:hypothetical protein